jgi:hypothetical protein
MLFYPTGISLLLDGLGPLAGVLALPFAPFGLVAAYNGSLVLGMCLSGYCAFLLARDQGLGLGSSLFAGAVLEVFPIHLAAVLGHLEKTFVGLLPLLVLTLLRALDQKRSRWWCAAAALVMLLLGLYSGYQFIMGAFGAIFFVVMAFMQHPRERWRTLVLRTGLVCVAGVLLVGPLIVAILVAESNPMLASNLRVNIVASLYEPDLVQLVMPPFYNATIAPHVYHYAAPGSFSIVGARKIPGLGPTDGWFGVTLENAVAIPLTALALCFLTILRGSWMARRWVVFAALCAVASLGPMLRVLGHTTFTSFRLPVVMPFAFVDSLPGLEFFRAPGRIMMVGGVGVALGAAWGLSWLSTRYSRYRGWIVAAALALLLLEGWPRPWPQTPLPPASPFYSQMAADHHEYGVLDLPAAYGPDVSSGWFHYASIYQMYQMYHKKPIAWGYLSRTYDQHPTFYLRWLTSPTPFQQPGVLVDGRPSPIRYDQSELAADGYRYVIYHKQVDGESPDTPEHVTARRYIDEVFGPDAVPYYEDSMLRVYRVRSPGPPRSPTPVTEMNLRDDWQDPEPGGTWAISPATVTVFSPTEQDASLEITLGQMHGAGNRTGVGPTGTLNVTGPRGSAKAVNVETGRTAPHRVHLLPGKQTISLALQAGNFRPWNYGSTDTRLLSFEVTSINLITGPHTLPPGS